MANIIDSLFGPTPYDVGQQRNQQDMSYAEKVARMGGFEQAKFGIGQGAAGLTRAGAGMMGMVDPAVEEAKMREQTMGGLDTSSSKSILMTAERIQDPRIKFQLVQLARQRQAEEQKAAMDAVEMKRKEAQTERELALAERALRPEGEGKPPASVQEYLYARQQGYKGSFEAWKNSQKVEGTKVVLPTQENAFEKELGGGQAKELMEGRKLADDAVQMLQTNKIGRQILDKGMVTGFGANAIVGIGQALKQAGINFGGDASANAQAYTSVMAQNVGKLIKQFGAGTGLSDADREYATKMAAGSIAVDEAAIRKVLDINDRAAKNVIALHNKRASKVKTNVPLTVDVPEETGSDLAAAARAELERRGGKK